MDSVWKNLTGQLSRDGAEFEAAICLLVAVVHPQQQQEEGRLHPLLEWCVERNFELIEWSPREDRTGGASQTGGDEASGGSLLEKETTGAARLAEALEAHVWPDITMKSSGSGHAEEKVPPVVPSASADKVPPNVDKLTKQFLNENEKLLAEGLGEDKDDGNETFEDLFARFAEMKGNPLPMLSCS